ncbi:ead/Ea22-like family protein [Salmonella enterica]|uniref:Ead/Ea22-like family protein n=1 Tax=Salmonella enterica TaxID=28901 RepID=A0A629ZEU1_SALER|nr:ead/Ea22-like family protein [Salmonella enterica]EDU1650895.1 ead/Ea22-like family protein [Salmonella enterica subsp. enterica serovar Javiana]EBD5645715.1 ead/Ea22-like family protein [Salmonella enterica]EBI2218357.1 ead/Ea22-like family protein [Salmonella enterica]EBI2229214.1 ead/Ea22-like family protein [Salmonella enterica]EBP2298606.1 ead/Ea22-like family protein [Salmonella enterica]
MTIDKQALREAAEKATPGNWHRSSSRFNGITATPFSLCGEEVMLAHTVEKRDAEFIAAANPATMLALLDENLQLQREKDAIEAVALALRDDMRQAREQLEAAEKRIADGSKRIAELESNEVREVGNKFLVVRHPGKTPAIKHCTGDLEDFLRKLIEQDPLVTIDIITHRYYGVGGQWVQDTGEYLQMMQGAGIGVKGE